jgi:hypothetical protein
MTIFNLKLNRMNIMKLIFGERVVGEKLPPEPKERIVYPKEKLTYFEWSRMFNVSTRAHQHPTYYEA